MLTTFLDRLMRVIGDRKPFSWARTVGWNKGTMSKVMEGHVPGSDLLIPVSRVENVRLDWLLMGRGTPYFAAVFADDATADQALRYHLEDSADWEILLLSGPEGRFAVALTMPAEIEFKGKAIAYTAIELLIGNLGAQVRQRVIDAGRQGRKIMARRMQPDAWYQLQLGEIGAYWLLDAEERIYDGQAVPFQTEVHRIKVGNAVAEEQAAYGGTFEVITPELHELLDSYSALNRDDRGMITHLLDRLRSTKPRP